MLCGIAISRLGLSIKTFYELSPKEFHYALKDQQEREKLKIELSYKTAWEVMRLQTTILLNSNPYVKKKVKKPEQLFGLSWDVKEREKSAEWKRRQIQSPETQLKILKSLFPKAKVRIPPWKQRLEADLSKKTKESY